MKRFILAFLALLGLVAQAAPASAHLGCLEAAQHGAVLGQSGQRQALVVRQVARRPSPSLIETRKSNEDAVPARAYHSVLAPTVNIEIDRTRQ